MKPDYIFVHGDTTTSTFSAISAFYHQITVCHVEAGLRTYNKYSPFPEEMNRSITGRIADYHFAPTIQAKKIFRMKIFTKIIYLLQEIQLLMHYCML